MSNASLTASTSRYAGSATSRRAATIAGRAISGVVLAFLSFDVIGKLVQPAAVVEGTVGLGFDAALIPVIGILLLVGVVLYAVPRTAFLGAVWTTAYLGGAVCANVRAELPIAGYVLAPVYVAVLLWAGLYLRSARLRELVRHGR